MFLVILLSFPALTLIWWALSDRLLRGIRSPWAKRLRVLIAVLMAAQILILATLIGSRAFNLGIDIPVPLLTIAYVWNLFVLPVLLVPSAAVVGVLLWRNRRDRSAQLANVSSEEPAPEPSPESGLALSRREFLALTAVAAPPLFNVIGTAHALQTLDDFRVRELDVPITGLPPALDGLHIAHLTDTHVGKFSGGKLLARLAERTNQLQPDLIAITGDIIDHSLDDLPEAIAFMRDLQAKHGTWLCEGNHDLFQSRERFEFDVRNAGLNLLVNEVASLSINGVPVVVMGLRWGVYGASRRNAGLRENLDVVTTRTGPPDAFRLLLAHHPHVLDEVEGRGIPLILAGHTHGGQLMVGEDVGAGPLFFRYWSGLYQKHGSSLVVSNGAGNWFPLRLGAPAEIVSVRLRAV
jgi:hypothetical protein